MIDSEELGIGEDDIDLLKTMRGGQSKKKKSFQAVINSRDLSDDELDELFLDDI